jgi:hypothetical protein
MQKVTHKEHNELGQPSGRLKIVKEKPSKKLSPGII